MQREFLDEVEVWASPEEAQAAIDVFRDEYNIHTGRNDWIQRTAQDAVALFWRFMIEKFGIHPTPTGAPPGRPSPQG